MRAFLYYLTVLHHKDAVCIHDCGKSMGYDDDCRFIICQIVLGKAFYWLLNHSLAIGIQGWSGLIENDDFRFPHECSSNGYSLFLSSTEVVAFFSYLGKKFFGESFRIVQKLQAASTLCCFFHFLKRVIYKSISDVILNCSWKKSSVLVYQSYLFPHADSIYIWLRMRTVVYLSWFNGVELLDKLDNRWLSWPTFPDECDVLALSDRKANIF